MKKIFLLIGATLFSLPTYSATIYEKDNLNFSIDGNLAGYAVYNNNAEDNENKFDISGYGEIHFNAEMSVNHNNKFGAYIELETNPYNRDNKKDKIFEETYIYGEGNYGRFEIGRAKNISRKMHITTPDVGILDIDGSWGLDYILSPSGFVYIGSTAINTDRESNKINYISPSFYGFQIAGSYIPGSDSLNGDNSLEYDKFKSGFTSSLKYSIDDGYNFAITAGYGRFNNTQMPISQAEKREEFSIGAKYYIKGFQFTASYKNIKESEIINILSQDGYALNYGIAYEIGPFAISLANHKSNVENLLSNDKEDTLNLSLLSTKYTIANGVDFALSIGRIAYKTENETSSVGLLSTTGFMINF